MKRNLERCQRFDYHSDIYLRPASDSATQRCTFVSSKSTRSLVKSRTFSLADGLAGKLEHSSRASRFGGHHRSYCCFASMALKRNFETLPGSASSSEY